jgi:hypothetical protein
MPALLKDIDSPAITIYTQDANGQWIEVTEPDTALKANSAKTPYGFALPKGTS